MQAKIFTETTEDGIVVHWEVEHENLDGLTAATGRLIDWLRTNEFVGHKGFGNGSGTGKGVAPAKQDSGAPRCRDCGGEMWDNRNNKRNPKAPDFKCKDKVNCDGAAWIQKDGELRWAGDK